MLLNASSLGGNCSAVISGQEGQRARHVCRYSDPITHICIWFPVWYICVQVCVVTPCGKNILLGTVFVLLAFCCVSGHRFGLTSWLALEAVKRRAGKDACMHTYLHVWMMTVGSASRQATMVGIVLNCGTMGQILAARILSPVRLIDR